jgi:endonuclease YncB( thermonuclease family)
MGTLRVTGIIDTIQFWPLGSSDADTTKIKLIVGDGSFEYKKTGSTKFVKTNAYKDAISRGQVSKQVITTSKRTNEQSITVRLQGIDAPELHYRAAPLKTSDAISDAKRKVFNDTNHDRRQCFAETSTQALATHLKQFANPKGLVKAIFETEVDHPGDAVDTYGRFVGNIRIGAKNIINYWLVENGWGHPAFYASMSKKEIDGFLVAWAKGKSKTNRPGKSLSKDAGAFDWNLLYRRPNVEKPIVFKQGEDKGKVLMPKIFRRQVSWMIAKKAKVITNTTSFHTYLKTKPDDLYLLKDYLANVNKPANKYFLHDFVNSSNKVLKNPEDLVFKEKPAKVVNSKGKTITNW